MNILSLHEKELKTQKIAQVAKKILSTRLYDRFNGSIARQSGIAKGTLFNYFETKKKSIYVSVNHRLSKVLQKVIQQWQNFPSSLT